MKHFNQIVYAFSGALLKENLNEALRRVNDGNEEVVVDK